MIDQYKDSGPKPIVKLETEQPSQKDLQIEHLKATLHKHEGEISFLRREVSRLKSDIAQIVNTLRRRG